jgi:hypothetical protein
MIMNEAGIYVEANVQRVLAYQRLEISQIDAKSD